MMSGPFRSIRSRRLLFTLLGRVLPHRRLWLVYPSSPWRGRRTQQSRELLDALRTEGLSKFKVDV